MKNLTYLKISSIIVLLMFISVVLLLAFRMYLFDFFGSAHASIIVLACIIYLISVFFLYTLIFLIHLFYSKELDNG